MRIMRVVGSYLSPGLSPTFVTIVLLLPANYSIFPDYGHFLFSTHIFSGCLYFMNCVDQWMKEGCVDHGSQSFGVNGNSGSNGNVTHRKCT